ncbi:MAG: hypothetical protein GQ570_04170 [Helicobacteraceae bacterium]|nr:hypothetical protein [Helicobacteraceae bacterium]
MKLYILIFLPVLLFGETLTTLIENAKNSHTSLETIKQRVATLNNEYDISRNFEDPSLSFNISDIQFADPMNRGLEAMQYSSISLKQKIPYFGKRDANSKKVDAKKDEITLSLELSKVKLVESIKTTAYSIWQIEEILKITNEYIDLTKHNIELYSNYGSNDTKSHMSIMSAEMTLSELKIKKSQLSNSLMGFYKKLSYLSAMNVKSLELNMSVSTPKTIAFYINSKTTNLSYKLKEASLKVANEDIKVKELSSAIDPIVQVGYYYREKYKDYANIGISFSVPLYGTQSSRTMISKKLALSSKSEVTDLSGLLVSQISQTHASLINFYDIYNIIQNQSMPQIEHMFELSSSYVKNGEELLIYISLLEKKLSLDEKNIEVIANFHKTKAILGALIGESK